MNDQQDADTEFDPSEVLQCLACGRNFTQSNTYTTHVRSCRPQRKRMASALEAAKETYKRKKFRTTLNPPTLNPPDYPQASQSNLQIVTPQNEVSL